MLLLSASVCAGVCVLQTATTCRCFPGPLERDWPRRRRRSHWPCAGVLHAIHWHLDIHLSFCPSYSVYFHFSLILF